MLSKIMLALSILVSLPSYGDEAMRLRSEFTGDDKLPHTIHGSCAAVGKDLIVTALHNTEHGGLFVEFDGAWHKASVVYKSPHFDIAFCKVEGVKFVPLKLQPTGACLVAGSEHGETVKLKPADCCSITIYVKQEMRQGLSGAPVITDKGKLLAVVVSLQGEEGQKDHYTEAKAVSADIIAELLSEVE